MLLKPCVIALTVAGLALGSAILKRDDVHEPDATPQRVLRVINRLFSEFGDWEDIIPDPEEG